MASKNVTFDDIAQYTNFSKTTISRYFNNPDSLTLKNQETIKQALVDLNYKENKLAKALAKGNSEFVGIILPNMFFHYYTEVLNQILISFEKYGYKFLVFLGDDNSETEKKYIDELLAFQIEGLIVLSHTLSSKELSNYDIPIVTIEREDEYVNSVNSDNYSGAIKATKHLIDQDCDLLIHINSVVDDTIPSSLRIKGFEDTCKKNQIEYLTLLDNMGSDFTSTNETIRKLFDFIESKYPNKKKGIFFANDTYANLFLNCVFRKYGKLIENYKIIGFDDSPIAKQGILPMSTIDQKIEEIASETMDILVDLMKERKKRNPKPQKELVHKFIEPKLIIRETT